MPEELPENLTSLLRAIENRRSFPLVRLQADRPVDRPLIEKLLEAANWAPSHGGTEPWRFTVYTGESRRALGQAFSEAYRMATPDGEFKQAKFDDFRDRVWSAPVWIAVAMSPALRPDGTPVRPEVEEIIAVGSAIQNLHLAASAAGLGGKWTTGSTLIDPYVAGFVGLKPPARLLGFFYLGWPKGEWPQGTRGPVADKVRWVEEVDPGSIKSLGE
ncbi:MAG TPA: nitroreductase [Armatimonadota bacterium]|jgi:nitroreductase